jgi:hypothetical protein
VLSAARVIEPVEDSEPVHAEVLGHGVGCRRLQVYRSKPLTEPTLDILRSFGEEGGRRVDGAASTRFRMQCRNSPGLEKSMARCHPFLARLVVLGCALAAVGTLGDEQVAGAEVVRRAPTVPDLDDRSVPRTPKMPTFLTARRARTQSPSAGGTLRGPW